MNRTDQMANRILQSNQRLKALCIGLSFVLVLVIVLKLESSADARPDSLGDLISSDAVSVDDSAGFAVFVREDGKIVIVHKYGKVIVTDGHPMAVGL